MVALELSVRWREETLFWSVLGRVYEPFAAGTQQTSRRGSLRPSPPLWIFGSARGRLIFSTTGITSRPTVTSEMISWTRSTQVFWPQSIALPSPSARVSFRPSNGWTSGDAPARLGAKRSVYRSQTGYGKPSSPSLPSATPCSSNCLPWPSSTLSGHCKRVQSVIPSSMPVGSRPARS